jgi:hypothetical protein
MISHAFLLAPQVSESSDSSSQAAGTSIAQLVALLRTALADPHGLSLRGIEAAQQGMSLLPQHVTTSSNSSTSNSSSSWSIEHSPVMTAALLQLAAGADVTDDSADFFCSVITRALHVHTNPAPLAGAVLSALSNSSNSSSSSNSSKSLVNSVQLLYGMPTPASTPPSISSSSGSNSSAKQSQRPWRLLLHILKPALNSSSSSSSRSEGVAALMAAVAHEPPAALPLLCRQACAHIKLHCTAQAQQQSGSPEMTAVVTCALDIVAELLMLLATAASTTSSAVSSEASDNGDSSNAAFTRSTDEHLHSAAEASQQLMRALAVVYSDGFLLELALHSKAAGYKSCSAVVAEKLAATLQAVAQRVPAAVAVGGVQQWLEQLCTAVAAAAAATVTDPDSQG